MPVVFIDNVRFRHSFSVGDLGKVNATILSARASAKEKRLLLGHVIKIAPEHAPVVISKFLKSEAVILCAAIHAAKKMRWAKRPKLDQCLALPKSSTVDKPISEPSFVRARPKKELGDFRVTHDFGLKHRTSQRMVAWVLGHYYNPPHWQFTMSGTCKAIADVKSRLHLGHVYFATLDIKNFFGSFDQEKLATELPLPLEWVDYVVIGRHLAVEADKRMGALPYGLSPHDLLHLARQGIPLGSSCSPIVAAYCTAMLQWNASADVWLINYADNFLLLASSATALEMSIGALTGAVANLPGGPFALKLTDQGHAGQGFNFLGYRLWKSKSKVHTSITLANQETITSKLNDLDTKIGAFKHHGKSLMYLTRMAEVVDGWLGAFSECDDIQQWKNFFDEKICENAKLLKVKMTDLKAGPQDEFDPADYFEGSGSHFGYSFV